MIESEKIKEEMLEIYSKKLYENKNNANFVKGECYEVFKCKKYSSIIHKQDNYCSNCGGKIE